MLNTNSVVLKLYKDGMVVFLNENMPFETLKKAVVEKFIKSKDFFR